MYIPKKIKVGFNSRQDTYSGKLAFVIYWDDRGKLRCENSWRGWIDKDAPVLDLDNEPVTGFVIHSKVGDYGSGWDHRKAKIRIHDPRDFEIEITPENLLYIIKECGMEKGGLIPEECIYYWEDGNIHLIPIASSKYQEYENAKIKVQNAIDSGTSYGAKNLQVGMTYITPDGTEWVYMGKHFEYSLGYAYFDKKESRIKYTSTSKSIPLIKEKGDEVNNSKYSKHVFETVHGVPSPKTKFVFMTPSKIIKDGFEHKMFSSIPKNTFTSCIEEINELYPKMLQAMQERECFNGGYFYKWMKNENERWGRLPVGEVRNEKYRKVTLEEALNFFDLYHGTNRGEGAVLTGFDENGYLYQIQKVNLSEKINLYSTSTSFENFMATSRHVFEPWEYLESQGHYKTIEKVGYVITTHQKIAFPVYYDSDSYHYSWIKKPKSVPQTLEHLLTTIPMYIKK